MNKIIVAATLSLFSLCVFADTTVNGKLSTLGLGAEAAFPLTTSVDGRVGLNTFKRTISQTSNSTDYNGDLNLQTFEALADWHPFEGSFRVSGGLFYNNNKLTMAARPSGGNIYIGGVPYPAAGVSVNSNVEFNKVAPYLGIGWGRTPKNTGLSFTSDIGILFQGTPKSSVTTSGIPSSVQLTSDTAKANSDLNDALKSFNIYPVLSFGIGYSF